MSHFPSPSTWELGSSWSQYLRIRLILPDSSLSPSPPSRQHPRESRTSRLVDVLRFHRPPPISSIPLPTSYFFPLPYRLDIFIFYLFYTPLWFFHLSLSHTPVQLTPLLFFPYTAYAIYTFSFLIYTSSWFHTLLPTQTLPTTFISLLSFKNIYFFSSYT